MSERIDPRSAALLIVDVQERFEAAMPPEVFAGVLRNVSVLVEAARRLEVPVVVSQQYPKGLGSTCRPVEEALATLAEGQLSRLDKLEFSACGSEHFAPIWKRLGGRKHWIVAGIECHVCVYQTVRDLRHRGAEALVTADAVCSRSKQNWRIGLELMRGEGAAVTSTETVLFDLLGAAGTDDFKALSRLIR